MADHLYIMINCAYTIIYVKMLSNPDNITSATTVVLCRMFVCIISLEKQLGVAHLSSMCIALRSSVCTGKFSILPTVINF